MIVVFDSNIWKGSLFLRSPSASAVRTYLKLHDARVCVPEIVRLEVERHAKIETRRHREALRESFDRLLAVFGSMREVILPDDQDIEHLADRIFAKEVFDFFEVPFDLEAARESFIRTVEKRRPSHRTQQFKDGVLWWDCKRLARDDEVILVTGDKAFYENDDFSQGLAKELEKELEGIKFQLKLMPDLKSLLDELRRPINVGDALINEAVESSFGERLDSMLQDTGYARAALNPSVAYFCYGTE